MRLLADGEFVVAALDREPAAGDAEEPANQPQQRRFACPVAAGDGQGFAGCDAEAHAGEHLAAAAPAGKIGTDQSHRRCLVRGEQQACAIGMFDPRVRSGTRLEKHL